MTISEGTGLHRIDNSGTLLIFVLIAMALMIGLSMGIAYIITK